MLKKLVSKNGFTLVELLVVIAILGVLVSVTLVAFRSSQARGRDAQRKSDLKQISSALELYYSDYGEYPADSGGQIQGCNGNPCTWGSGEFTDGRTVYFKAVPKDPSDYTYFYRIPDPPGNQKFQLFSYLENTQDLSLIVTSYSCGPKNCNFSITSPNTTPSE
jgi:type II secretion system protein G